ncbi:MAG: hypothetical protein KFH98_15215 [Gemmatimonadetes bacterium]|nr:hypothetical protein [Gemmatimonadota bacterium]
MVFLIIGGLVAALGVGIWVGLGAPGFPGGREDRVVKPGHAHRLKKRHIDLLRSRR